MAKATANELREEALKSGMTTLRENARAKVLEGATTPEEVARATME